MRPGSVIVDLAVERGGNCELSRPGETVISENGVKIIGNLNVAGRVAATASFLYAKNLVAFLQPLIDPASHELAINWDDEIIKATLLTRDGALAHPNFQAPAAQVAPAAEVAPAEQAATAAEPPVAPQQAGAEAAPAAEPPAPAPAAPARQRTRAAKSSDRAGP